MDMNLLDPGLLDQLWSFYPSTCQIQRKMTGTDPYGSPSEQWSTIYDNLPYSISPPTGNERRMEYFTTYNITDVIALQRNLPDIRAWDRLVFAGTAYDIVSVQWSEFGSQTVLNCRKVEGVL